MKKLFLLLIFVIASFSLSAQMGEPLVKYDIINYRVDVLSDSLNTNPWRSSKGQIILYKEFIELNGFFEKRPRDIYFILHLDKNETKCVLIQLGTKALIECWFYRLDKNAMVLELNDGIRRLSISYFVDFT